MESLALMVMIIVAIYFAAALVVGLLLGTVAARGFIEAALFAGVIFFVIPWFILPWGLSLLLNLTCGAAGVIVYTCSNK